MNSPLLTFVRPPKGVADSLGAARREVGMNSPLLTFVRCLMKPLPYGTPRGLPTPLGRLGGRSA
jgi:hypothetical protein